MKIIINNREKGFDTEAMTVTQLLAAMRYNFPMIVIKVNGVLVKKEQQSTFAVKDGDKVDAIHLIGGG